MTPALIAPTRAAHAHRIHRAAQILIPIAAILALAIAAIAYNARTKIVDRAQTEQTDALAQSAALLASQIELALADDDLPRVRRLLLDAQASRLFLHAAINVEGQELLSSSNLAADTRSIDDVNPISSPAPTSAPADTRITVDTATSRITILEPLSVHDMPGSALLLRSELRSADHAASTLSLVALIAAVAAASLLVCTVVTRAQRLGALYAIRSALTGYASGETATPALLVHERLGPEAAAFNRLLTERDELRATLDMTQATTAATTSADDASAAACKALPHGLIVVDSTQNIRLINAAAAIYLGTTPENARSRPLGSLENSAELTIAATSILAPDAPRREQTEFSTPDASTHLRASCSRCVSDDETLVVILIEDITQQRHADESLNAFIAQATHELRTPLTNIRLYAEEAVDAGAEDEEFRSNAFNMINSESRRLERIVSDMLSVSELEAGSMTLRTSTVNAGAIFDELQRDYPPQAQAKGIRLNFDVPPKIPPIEADHDRLAQAIHNIIGNAIKYTPAEGTVSVSLAFDPDNTMIVKVTDTGIGISHEDQTLIFERFCRATDKRVESITGTGLGLAITREIARMHGGDLTVESQLDQGSTFTLTIPASRQPAKQAA